MDVIANEYSRVTTMSFKPRQACMRLQLLISYLIRSPRPTGYVL